MSLVTKTANDTFAPYDAAGNPRQIVPHDAQVWGTEVERALLSFQAGGGIIFPNKPTMDAALTYAANQMAWVIGDATVANNGVYRKTGASGTGSWVRLADLPYSFIIATDAGAGTANAIQATTSIPVSGSALIWMNIFEANASSPVTISFNGGSALTVKTNGGNDVAAGGLTAGMIVLGIVSGSTFRLVSDQASAAIVAAAEAAQAAAEAAAAEAEAILANTVQQTNSFASAGIAVKYGTIASGSTANSIIGDPGDGSPIPSTLFATADYPFYSVGGYVPGPHMFGANIFTMRTTRDENAQEQAVAIQFINETGRPVGVGTSINNGKSGLTVHGRAVDGGGNMWGAAIAVDIEENYDHGFVAITEFDVNNRNKNCTLGGDFNVAGLFMNSISHYRSTAGIWMTGYELQPNETWLYGMFFQGPMVIKDATILEDSGSDVVLDVNGIGTTPVSGKNAHDIAVIRNRSTSPYLIIDQGYHQNAFIRDASTAPVGLDIAGIKGAFDARLNGAAPVGLAIQGARATAIIDVSTATGGPALNMADAQVLKWTNVDMLQFGAELLFRKTGGALMGRFSPTVTNNELNLIVTARISAADTEKRIKFGATGTGPGGVGRAIYIDN